ncbi:uncharacterized protein PITG_00184 [Phytophthora infestans T30-4]|uniref:25S rRNA (uridine-N(3))-methyltransferase BMT5-like domain-containing protein n=2 Tax=Phytophthora infestans TaxID=4787 RepID=D0MQ54_PHYIT|nr:uncharacterized protein PITG_00184 [Phytophthora infestans T30-4]EEY57623.1 conserved hypothetical protein [Phytophthora infestans T30-4]|eukprot:XP_002908809.1 conserved hypothetical protein [Phytophthora infestans T30-4]
MPNVRPEMCPRMASKVNEHDAKADGHSIGLYDAAQVKRILTVGDGNFSYSLALARALGPDSGVQLVTTSHESKKSVVETYPDGEKILEELNAMSNVTIQHEVDATDAKQMKTLGQFDRVIWNFPCVRAPRGEDGQNEEMEINKKLLNDFFAHVAQILTPTGEVHVTHKTKKPFGQWGIESIAKANKLRHHQSVVFDRCLYPGYSNKKVLSKGSFPIWDSLTFIFVPEDRVQPEVDAVNSEDAEENTPIEPVTMDILKKMYLLLAPSLDDMLGSKKKKKKGFRGLNSSQKDVSISLKGSKEKSGDKSNNIHKGNSKRKLPASGNLKVGKRKKSRRS